MRPRAHRRALRVAAQHVRRPQRAVHRARPRVCGGRLRLPQQRGHRGAPGRGGGAALARRRRRRRACQRVGRAPAERRAPGASSACQRWLSASGCAEGAAGRQQPMSVNSPSIWAACTADGSVFGEPRPVHGSAARLLRHLLHVRRGSGVARREAGRRTPRAPAASGPACWPLLDRFGPAAGVRLRARPNPIVNPAPRGRPGAGRARVRGHEPRARGRQQLDARRPHLPAGHGLQLRRRHHRRRAGPRAELHGGAPLHRRRAAATWEDQQRREKRISVWLSLCAMRGRAGSHGRGQCQRITLVPDQLCSGSHAAYVQIWDDGCPPAAAAAMPRREASYVPGAGCRARA
jgi:hypothetical protein